MGEHLDLDRDLPTTTEDIDVLRRLRTGPALSFEEYLRALAAIQPPTTEMLRQRQGPRGAPFDLL